MSAPTRDRWGTQPTGFDRQAAETVFKAMMALDDDSALVFGRALVADLVNHDLVTHGTEIRKVLDERFAARAERARVALSRSVVAKARSGEDDSAPLAALVALSRVPLAKAYGDDPYNRNARGEFASADTLGARGVAAHAHIGYDSDHPTLHPKHAEKLGIPRAEHLSGKDQQHYQQAYRQIADMVAPYRGMGHDALLHLNIEGPKGHRSEVKQIPAPGAPLHVHDLVHPKERITSASVSVHPSIGASGAAYDALAAIGQPRAGAAASTAVRQGALNADRLRQFGEESRPSHENQNEMLSPSARLFRRLGAGSKLLEDSLGDAAPRKLRLALAVGQHVGSYGPEAQKVIGPTADRTAYRYRGTERAVDSRLLRAFQMDRDTAPAEQRRLTSAHGTRANPAGAWEPSKTLDYFRGLLPKSTLNDLQLKSGTVPPSQGVIINSAGRPVVQAVGYGDDWYLPFNLKHLAKLKGGTYIRTRTWGGPTTEDIYTGLMSGAKGLTVVSHNGVYNVRFDDTLRGGRRFSDKAARMVARYGHLLDAVKSEQVTEGNIAPSKMRELRQQAARLYDPVEDRKDYDRELDKLVAQQRENPTHSKEQRDEASMEWLRRQAGEHKTPDGHEMTVEEYVDDLATHKAQEAQAEDRVRAQMAGATSPFTADDFRRQIDDELHSDDPSEAAARVAALTGRTKAYEAYLKDAENDYANSLRPMQLNGRGYANSLEALKEQFPYYIASVSYHPWADAVQGKDTGYVKPRHNRPEKALAGYFDPDVTGQPKVRAHTTRYQNYPVHHGKLRPYGDAATKEGEEGEKTAGTSQTAKGSKDSELDADTAARLRQDADREMLRHLFAQEFHPQAQFEGVNGSLAGRKPAQDAVEANFPNAELKGLYGKPEHEQMKALENPAQADAVRRAMERVLSLHEAGERVGHPLFAGLEPAKVQAFRNGGKVVKPQALPQRTNKILDSLDVDHAGLGGAYERSRTPGKQAVEDAYQNDGRIQALVQAGRLPDLHATDFGRQAKALQRDLQHADAQLLRDRADSAPGVDSRERAVQRQAEGLARAMQLHRRYEEAVARDVVTQAPTESATTENHLELHGLDPQAVANMSDDEWEQFARRMGLGGTRKPNSGPSGVIEG